MKSFCFIILTLAVLAQAEDGKAKEKRGLADSSPYASPSNGPLYTKSVPSSPAQQEYLSQAQQYYQAETQGPQSRAVAYAQPAVSKYAVPALQKIAYAPQPQQHSIPYSSAAEVSSFSYSSPVVQYNNLGLLHQLAGKTASSQDSPVTYNTAPSSKAQYSATQYSPAPKNQFAPSPKVQYSSAPRVQYSSPPRVQYTSSPNAYEETPNYEEIYQQLLQKANYRAPASPAAGQYQEASYQQSPVAQREEYAQAPSPVAYQTKVASPQVAYTRTPSQYYSFQAPQATQAHQAQQAQQAYQAQTPQVTPVYESSAQSAPEAYYGKSSAAASEVSQYYSPASHSRYAKPGVTYA
ncbi:hypothetical protein JTB14_022576 [Gonioctena quinquepunctata]|nr:hypothetical protein JTB14_022576 [Gonioctena quinquepunctata]